VKIEMFDLILVIFAFIGGLILIIYSSKFAVKHAAMLATALGISPIVIGVTLVSIGTDIPEFFNSLISCSMGHGDIDVGDSTGSVLTQITLVFGLLPLVCGVFYVHRRDVIILGACQILSIILIFTVVEKGYFTRLDAILMVTCMIVYFWFIYNANKESIIHRVEILDNYRPKRKKKSHFIYAMTGFAGVALASFIIVESIIYISTYIGIHEYIISFFVLSIGTSLPELAVDINALRTGQHSIAVGDIIGSCIVDSTLSIGIGQVFFPQAISSHIILPTIIYALIASILVIFFIVLRKKVDRKIGLLFIGIYILAFFLLFRV